MSKAWMPLTVSLLFMGVGCQTGAWNWGRNTPPPQQQPITPPTAAAASQPADSESVSATPTADAEVDPLASRVQQFVGQFPPDDRDRLAAAAPTPAPGANSTLPPNTATAGPEVAATEPPRAIANRPPTVRNLAEIYPTAAALPAPSALGPAESVRHAAPEKTGTTLPAAPAMAEPAQAAAPRLNHPDTGKIVELIDVRPAANKAVGAASRPAPPAANQPIKDAAPAAPSLAGMIAELENTLIQAPQPLETQFKLRLLYAANGEEDKAVGPLKGADPVQTDLAAAVFRVVQTTRQAMRDPAGSSAASLAAIDELRRLIGQQSPVLIPKVAMVTRVNSFGDYEAVQPAHFAAGQPVHVFLYTEVANFRTETTPDNRIRTLLAEKVEIFDSSGKIIWQRAEPNIEDKSLTPRHDFFMTMEVQLPADTPAGDYVLKVTIEDKIGATTDQQRMSFSIK